MNVQDTIHGMQKAFSDPENTRLRSQPRYSDQDYFHFADLDEFIKRNAVENKIVLDYGAGSAPYEAHFRGCDYRKADLVEVPGLRYRIGMDSTVPEADQTFDLILSSQVAEHVADTGVYFRECFRLLKPGGRLLLTTIGIWEEHGVPFDFQRWTEQGMRRDLEQAGFKRPEIYKLTCGFRALIFLFTHTYFRIIPPARPVAGRLFRMLRFIYSRLFPLIYRLTDKCWPEDNIVKAIEGTVTAPFYICIAAIAEKRE